MPGRPGHPLARHASDFLTDLSNANASAHALRADAMSAPARIGTCRSATALVQVNLGSTWMTVAPRALASITHWNPTGWHSAMFEPWIRMQSALARSCWNVVAPPRPGLAPDPVRAPSPFGT